MNKNLLGPTIAVLLLTACGQSTPDANAPGAAATTGSAAPAAAAPATTAASSGAAPAATAAPPSGSGTFAGRTGQLVNPDDSTMVFLYYDLAGIQPPIDRWVEDDSRVKMAQPIDKAATRAAVRAELEAAGAAVRGVGVIRVTMNANLSDYDPTYSEFTVRALAPSSVLTFSTLGQKVEVGFNNGLTAQIWKVPAEEAQAIRDKIGYTRNVSVNALLGITSVQPGPGGGRISANVLEYELREDTTGTTLARVNVTQQ